MVSVTVRGSCIIVLWGYGKFMIRIGFSGQAIWFGLEFGLGLDFEKGLVSGLGLVVLECYGVMVRVLLWLWLADKLQTSLHR